MAIKGRKFSITPIRKSNIIPLLERQHTIETLATLYGVTRKTMSRALKAAKIDPDAYRRQGMANVKAKMMERLENIDKDKDYVDMSLRVLDKYGSILDDDDAVSSTTGSKDKIKDAAMKIMVELDG